MTRRFVFLAVAAAMLAQPVVAQNWGQSFSQGARDARQSGNIVPLRDILRQLERQHGGEYLDANLYSSPGGGSEYHIDWKTRDGRKVTFVVNAQSGRVIRTQGG